MKLFVKLLVLILLYLCVAPTAARFQFVIKRLENCSKDNKTHFFINVTTENENQYLNFDVRFLWNLDENIGFTMLIETRVTEKTFLPIFTVREKYACKALNAYMGEFWYDIMRAAQTTPGVCPMLAVNIFNEFLHRVLDKRRYYVHQILLNFNKIPVQAYPFGRIRTHTNLIDNRSKTKDSLLCILAEGENISN